MAGTPIDVRGTVSRPLVVAVVDGTGNAKGFEHDTSKAIAQMLNDRGVAVVDGGPRFIDDMDALSQAVPENASAVLFFGHGTRPSADAASAAMVTVGTIAEYWQLLGRSGLDWSDKLVLLCVCWGYNVDAIRAVTESAVGALAVVAPLDSMTASEARAFFPEMLSRLQQTSPSYIDPDYVEQLIEESNDLAGRKVTMYRSGEAPRDSIWNA